MKHWLCIWRRINENIELWRFALNNEAWNGLCQARRMKRVTPSSNQEEVEDLEEFVPFSDSLLAILWAGPRIGSIFSLVLAPAIRARHKSWKLEYNKLMGLSQCGIRTLDKPTSLTFPQISNLTYSSVYYELIPWLVRNNELIFMPGEKHKLWLTMSYREGSCTYMISLSSNYLGFLNLKYSHLIHQAHILWCLGFLQLNWLPTKNPIR